MKAPDRRVSDLGRMEVALPKIAEIKGTSSVPMAMALMLLL
jgi:hypothetical protein